MTRPVIRPSGVNMTGVVAFSVAAIGRRESVAVARKTMAASA
jgi:hypothetical protein